MNASDIVEAARDLIGTPFHHQGRVPHVGLDCGGLVVAVCIRLGILHVDLQAYGRRPHGGVMETLLDSQLCLARIPIMTFQVGDLLLMRFKGDPQHLAIASDRGIIHAYEDAGEVVEHRLDTVWRRRIVRAYRFVGVTA